MKILVDNNLSHRLCSLLRDSFENMKHVNELGLDKAEDLKIWVYAGENNFHILTKDSDFTNLVNLKGFPPKVIQLLIGNASTKQIYTLIKGEEQTIKDFLEDEEHAVLYLK